MTKDAFFELVAKARSLGAVVKELEAQVVRRREELDALEAKYRSVNNYYEEARNAAWKAVKEIDL